MTDTALATAKLDIGRVIRETFGVIGRNFPTFFVLALLLVGLPALLQALLAPRIDLTAAAFRRPPNSTLSSLASVLVAVGYYVLLGALTYGVVTDLTGRKSSIPECLRIGLQRFWPLVGLLILMVLGLALGFVLLIVPGFILMTMWAVVVPAKVVENPPIMQAFSRSRTLTKGSRWRVFGLLLLYTALILIVETVFGVLAGGLRQLIASEAAIVIFPLITVCNALFGTTGTAVIYFELRRIREGVGPESLAAVFD